MPDTTPPVAPRLAIIGDWLNNPQVSLATSLGNVTFELYPNEAPATVANWLAYVGSGFYDNLIFHRVIAGFMIQGGGFSSGMTYHPPAYGQIGLESPNGLSNERGTLAMARTSAAHSATSQFFVNVVSNSFLDYASDASPGYAVFGRVVAGMAVVDAIAGVATTTLAGAADVPLADVLIRDAVQTRSGVVHSDKGLLAVTGIESAAYWEYSLDAGSNWTRGTRGILDLPDGVYETREISLRQTDAAGNRSAPIAPAADIVVDAGAVVIGTASTNNLTGTSGNESLYGLGGNDTLAGGAGNDRLFGGSGADLMLGGEGGDTLAGGAGTDTASYLYAGAAVTVSLATAAAQATGGAGSDTLLGIENLTGSSYADRLTGSGGNNVLTGGRGRDILKGNGGNDTFDFNALGETGITSATWDVITDFQAGDRIDLATLDAIAGTAANEAFVFLGSGAFTAAGQLRFDASTHVLYGSTDADSAAEFAIALSGVSSLSAAALVL